MSRGFVTPPECQGQIVEVSYLLAYPYCYRRTHDRSVRTTTYERCDLEWLDLTDVELDAIQPWNREPSLSDWEPCDESEVST